MRKRVSVRFPPEVHDRLRLNKLETETNLNEFIVEATEEKLDRDGVPRNVKIRRRKPAQSA